MQKLLATILIGFIALNVSASSASASTRNSNDLATSLKVQSGDFSSDAMPEVKVNEDDKLDGNALARPVAPITRIPTEVVAVGDADPTPQATPPSPQNPPVHHNHDVRGILIILALTMAMTVILVSLDK